MIYRRSHKALVLLAAFLLISSYNGSAADLVHQVAKGETVYSISRLYKISQDELMRYNNISDASKLQLGMKLSIPSKGSGTASLSAAPGWFEYRVLANETLYSIARNHGVGLQALRDINGFSKNYVLKAGEKIKIPGNGSLPVVMNPPPPGPINPPPVIPLAEPVIVKPEPKPAAITTARTADTSLRWPVKANEVAYMISNSGVLVSGKESESIKSLTGGIVVHASPWRGYGNVAVVETADGYRYLYGACETLSVRKGDSIEPGTELGKLGICPVSGKPDLVLIVSHNGSPVDPAKAPRF